MASTDRESLEMDLTCVGANRRQSHRELFLKPAIPIAPRATRSKKVSSPPPPASDQNETLPTYSPIAESTPRQSRILNRARDRAQKRSSALHRRRRATQKPRQPPLRKPEYKIKCK